ncbi:MAG: amidohydrolase family protein, partial [Candidatus Binatia bacterium]
PELFQKAIGGRLQDKALFGTDFPYVDLAKALVSFDKMGFKDTVKEKLLVGNARKLFGLSADGSL